MLAINDCQFNIHTALKLGTSLNLRRLRLPIRLEAGHKQDVVGIAHRNRNPFHLIRASPYNQFLADFGLPHLGLKLIFAITPPGQDACFQASPGLKRDPFFPLLRANICRDAACAVTGDFRFRAVSIEQSNLNIRRCVWKHPLHSVGAYAFVPVANAPRKGSQVATNRRSIDLQQIDQQKIIATRARFHKRDHHGRDAHSNSTGPNEVTLPSTADAFNCRNSSSCSR